MAYSDQSSHRILGIIPARYGSTRFPGKPLADINGKSMIVRVCEQSKLSGVLNDVVVATDDVRILEHVRAAGFEAVMTSELHRSGTDRCLEALDICRQEKSRDYEFVINIQGDEPFLAPENIREVAGLLTNKNAGIASLVKKITNPEEIENPNVVKAVFGNDLMALYFSRAPIPYLRGMDVSTWASQNAHFKHIGIYGYSAMVLREICSLPPGRLEQSESLEQLRWLEAGYRIHLALTELENISIDTPEDLRKITNIA